MAADTSDSFGSGSAGAGTADGAVPRSGCPAGLPEARAGLRPPAGALGIARAIPALLRATDGLLAGWLARAAAIPDAELRRQAQASLTAKRFHCEGGAVYALLAGRQAGAACRFIIALQTISDYLDNLADRSDNAGGHGVAQLHRAMVEAALPGGGTDQDPARFYRLHPHTDDGGYLAALVDCCRAELAALSPAGQACYATAAAPLVHNYCDLQVKKHLPRGREEAVSRWAGALPPAAAGLPWHEVAAATGSTLGIFALFCLALAGRLDAPRAGRIASAYFPWIGGLHILLDYFIDRDEDRGGGDLNFTFYYADATEGAARLRHFCRQALAHAGALEDAGFHRAVVRGLPALYLTDPKVGRQGLQLPALDVLRTAGPGAWLLYWAVRWFRARGALAH